MRAHVSAIKLLYEQMSSDARTALGWTPAMLKAGDDILQRQTGLFGKLNMDTVLAHLTDAAQKGGIGFSISDVKTS